MPALMYHSVSAIGGPLRDLAVPPKRLAEQLGALSAAGYRLVGLTEALDLLDAGSTEKLLAVTFDDGYRDFLTEGLPALANAGARRHPVRVGRPPRRRRRLAGPLVARLRPAAGLGRAGRGGRRRRRDRQPQPDPPPARRPARRRSCARRSCAATTSSSSGCSARSAASPTRTATTARRVRDVGPRGRARQRHRGGPPPAPAGRAPVRRTASAAHPGPHRRRPCRPGLRRRLAAGPAGSNAWPSRPGGWSAGPPAEPDGT